MSKTALLEQVLVDTMGKGKENLFQEQIFERYIQDQIESGQEHVG